MSGFLHQLARRSLGLAPRMRNATASPQLPTQSPAVRDQPWTDEAPPDPSGMGAAASATGLAALDQWARTQPRLAPQQGSATTPAQRGEHRVDDPAAAAHARPRAPTAPYPAMDPAAAAAPRPAAPLRQEAGRAAAQEIEESALEARAGAQPPLAGSDATPGDSPRGGRAANDVHANARPASAQHEPAWDLPVSPSMPARSATPERRPVPDVHITIDRLEVAPPAPVPRAAPPSRSAALSLRAYLAGRRSGQP